MMTNRYFRAIAVTVISLFLVSAAFAEPKDSKIRIGVNWGIKSDMASLGSTIVKDGVFDTSDTTIAKQGYGVTKVVMSEKDDATYVYNSKAASTLKFADSHADGGAMMGHNFGFDVEAKVFQDIFVRTGFNYVKSMSGGKHTRTLGSMDSGLAASLGVNPADFDGGSMTYEFTSGWYEIPLAIGFDVFSTKTARAYGGIGLSFFGGGWTLDWDMEEKYVRALTTHSEGGTVTKSTLPALKDSAQFKSTAIGLNYFVGVAAEVSSGVELFLEMYASGAAAVVYSEGYSDDSAKMLTSTMLGSSAASLDPTFMKNVAYPIVYGGPSFKFGVKVGI